MPPAIDLAVIGGSGFYEMPGLDAVDEISVDTPYGRPSDTIRVGMLGGRRVAFLARHGRRHTLLPSEIPQRANFWALKSLGVTRVLAVSAVGSLREYHRPGELVTPNQLVDRTNSGRPSSFFGEGLVAHVAFANPFCSRLRAGVQQAAKAAGVGCDAGGTLVVIEGPAFGTRAESELYRSWGLDLVGMTALPEAKLAREAELCYALLATVTDYDAWHGDAYAVDATTVLRVVRENVQHSQDTVQRLIEALPGVAGCPCQSALDAALLTPVEAVPAAVLERLAPILERRLGVAVK